MSVLVVLVILICVVIAVWPWLRQQPDAPPEFPGALPILGHSLRVLGDRKHLWKFLIVLMNKGTELGGVIGFWFPTYSLYMITDPEDSLTISNSCLNKPFFYDFAKGFINNGLITAEESVWKVHRRLLNPSFNQQVLNTYLFEMNVQARSLVSRLALKVGKGPFDVRQFFINYTLSSVTRTSLGLNTEDQTTIDTDYAEAIGHLLASYCDRFQRVWLHLSYIYNLSEMKRNQTKLMKELKNIIDPSGVLKEVQVNMGLVREISMDEVRKAVQSMKNGKALGPDEIPVEVWKCLKEDGCNFKPVLDQMLQLAEEKDVFTDSDIREHLDTFVAAAYDTTSSALTFLLLVIGSDRDVQERIFNELQDVLGHEDVDVTKQDLPKLEYMEAVIKESMRMHPSVPLFARVVNQDVKLKNCTLRAGSQIMIGVYGLLRHPLWGPDADQFKPERWLNSATLPDHPSLNAAFGVGKRNCIGKLYGMMVMKVALAHIVRRYYVTGDIKKLVCQYDVALIPVEGHHISLTQRT